MTPPAAQLYHRLTSLAPGREDDPDPFPRGWTMGEDHALLVKGFVPNVLENWPAACKAYPEGLPAVALPREWPTVAAPATSVLAGRHEPAAAALDLFALARVLHLSAGVVRVVEREDRPRLLLRASGSAGGRFPYELYVSAKAVDGIEDGVYWYDPAGHALVRIAPAAGGAATALVLTGVPWRSAWRYQERSLRHIYWDAGTMLAQTLALAESGGLTPRLWTRFPDAELSRLVGADGVHEFPLALLGLGDGPPGVEPRGEAATGAVDRDPLEFPLITQTQHAGDGDALGDPWPPAPPFLAAAPASDDLDAVILRRGSTRIMDPRATVSREVFEFAMAAAQRGSSVERFAAAHAVEGLGPGLYHWPELGRAVRPGPLKDEMFWACAEQDLCRDAAFVVIAAADIERLDDRGYREAQLDAGLGNGRLHLAAFALGIGASGMTFFDSEIAPLLGQPLHGLIFTCVGVPAYRNKRGGRPGAPTSVFIPQRR